MKVTFDKSFYKSLDKLKNNQVKLRVKSIIEKCEKAEKTTDIPNVKKLTSFDKYYRIKTGDYRIGVICDGITVDFITIAQRKDIYNIFP